MTEEKLKAMAEIDIRSADEGTVASFEQTAALAGSTPAETLKKLINKGYNLYFRKMVRCIVKISFANNGTSMADAVAAMLSHDGW